MSGSFVFSIFLLSGTMLCHSSSTKSIELTARVSPEEPAKEFFRALSPQPPTFKVEPSPSPSPSPSPPSSPSPPPSIADYEVAKTALSAEIPENVELEYNRTSNSFNTQRYSISWPPGVSITLQHVDELKYEGENSETTPYLKPYIEIRKAKLQNVDDKFILRDAQYALNLNIRFGIIWESTSPPPRAGRYIGSMVFIIENEE
ncbi:hypothetical protein ACWJJH_06310 [Endozoicomonadaceae bacterium StTr2]